MLCTLLSSWAVLSRIGARVASSGPIFGSRHQHLHAAAAQQPRKIDDLACAADGPAKKKTAEQAARCALAAAYRLVALYSWDFNIYNHITVSRSLCLSFSLSLSSRCRRVKDLFVS